MAQNVRSSHELCDPKEALGMKPINPFPLIAMLVIVVFLVLWINGVFA
jgi:hypothetical protein